MKPSQTTTQPTLLVLAAGIGSRYGGLKQIEAVGSNGETIMDYSIYDAVRAGFGRLVFVTRRDMAGPFHETIGARLAKHVPVKYVYQELDHLPPEFHAPPQRKKPWGTGHAVLMADGAIEGPFAAINADDFYGANSFRALAEHLRSGPEDFAMVGFTLRQTLSEFGGVARGVCRVGDDGYLQSVTELTKIEKTETGAQYTDSAGAVRPLEGRETVSMNIWGFTPALFGPLRAQFAEFLQARGAEEKSEFYIPSAVQTLISAGKARVKVLPTPDAWFGVTYREDLPRVRESIRALTARGDYPSQLWS